MNTTFRNAVMFLLVLGFAGCGEMPKTGLNDNFRPDDEARALNDFEEIQMANGARDDGTLVAAHFTGTTLNSLGTRKLDSMLYGHTDKLRVYLNLPGSDASYGGRADAVTTYLTGKGVAAGDVTVMQGINPNTASPAAQGLNGLGTMSKSAAPDVSAAGGATQAK